MFICNHSVVKEVYKHSILRESEQVCMALFWRDNGPWAWVRGMEVSWNPNGKCRRLRYQKLKLKQEVEDIKTRI